MTAATAGDTVLASASSMYMPRCGRGVHLEICAYMSEGLMHLLQCRRSQESVDR